MDSNNNQEGWAKVSNFDPLSGNQSGTTQVESVVATPAVEPRTPLQPQQPPQAISAADSTPENESKQLKDIKTFAIIASAAAAVFLGLSIWGLVSSILKSSENEDLIEIVNTQYEIISKIEEQTDTKISSVEDVPTYTPTTDNIYLGNWGIKIKIPKELKAVSYILNENYRPSICFNAYTEGLAYFPPFANIAKNPGKMGCLTRVATEEGAADSDGNSFGEQVFTNGGYNYFYTLPGTYSTDEAELGIENSSISTIKAMLKNNISAYK